MFSFFKRFTHASDSLQTLMYMLHCGKFFTDCIIGLKLESDFQESQVLGIHVAYYLNALLIYGNVREMEKVRRMTNIMRITCTLRF